MAMMIENLRKTNFQRGKLDSFSLWCQGKIETNMEDGHPSNLHHHQARNTTFLIFTRRVSATAFGDLDSH
jgi:hypothetical protein